MKKIISLLVTISIIAANGILSVTASGVEDYVPGEINANLIPDSTAGNGFTYFGTRISKAEYSDWGTSNQGVDNAFKYYYTESGDLVLTNAWGGFEGFFLNRNRSDNEGSFGFVPEAGKTYVFKANVKNASTNGATPSFGIALNGTWGPGKIVATNEYGTAGMKLSDEWQEFRGTLTLPSDFSDDTGYGCSPLVGFAAGAPEGSAFWLDVSEKDSVYFAEEQVYDMVIEASSDSDVIPAGSSANFKAEVINQIGIPGSLGQNFMWSVVNEEKTAPAEGFEFPEGITSDATIKVLDNAEPGDYYILAVSIDYGMIKTRKITVGAKDPFKEFQKGAKNKNLIPDATDWKWLGARNNGSIENAEGGGSGSAITTIKYFYSGTEDLALVNAWRGFEGFELNSTQHSESERWFTTVPGKTYVISMNVKNVSSKGVVPYLGMAINGTYNPGKINYTNEYGSTGMAVDGDDWMRFNGSITIPNNFSADTPFANSIFVGFPTGTKPGAAVLIDRSDKESTYIAEEQLYDITAEIEGAPEIVRVGDTVNVSASVVNQIGVMGGFKQNFRWFATDSEKKDYVEGFSFVKNGNNAQMTISDDVEVGTYYIYAESTDYPEMRRAIELEVQKALIGDRENISDNKADAKKIIIESNIADDVIEMSDEYVLKASLLNQEDLQGELEQEFNWYIINSDRATIAEGITAEKLDSEHVVVKIGLYAEPGEYFAVAEPVNYSGIRKLHGFTVEKPTAAEAAVELINSQTAEVLAENLSEYFKALNIESEYINKADKEELARIISVATRKEKFTAENVKDKISCLAIISLYNKNPENVELYDGKGNFEYRDILGVDEYFEGSGLSDVLDDILSDEGRIELQKELTGKNFANADEFMKAFSENLILKAIELPKTLGTEYIASILTKKNAEKAGINIDKYLSLSKKNGANQTLAREKYTKESLENAISNLKESGGSNGGNGGAGGGGSLSSPVSPSVITQNPQVLPNTVKDEFDRFEDVSEEHWAYDEIYHLKKTGVVSGDNNKFNPDEKITREQFVKMFIEAFGYENIGGELTYKDVAEDAWYKPYILTAKSLGLVNGVSTSEFGVGVPITRQDICVIAVRAMGTETDDSLVSTFTDFDSVSEYAKASVCYLSNYGVINGFADGSFRPAENCTRAQAAKIICTLMNLGGVSK